MMKCKSLEDVEAVLRPYSERVALTMGKGEITTDRTFELAKFVGSPQDRLNVIHVAGTSGKTSTSYFVAGLLKASGKRVGLTVSPHIESVAERALVGMELLSEVEYLDYFNEFRNMVESSSIEPTYFEFMMVFALWVFDREAVDYAVVETGFGGLFDASNICRRADKVCVITDIGYDHVQILGNTLGEISAQKAGIIAEKNLVCMYEQSAEVMSPVYAAVAKYDADLRLAPHSAGTTYQDRNFALAEFVYAQVAVCDGLPELGNDLLSNVRQTHIPGRLERLRVGETIFLLDGAHNEQKISTLFDTLDELYGGKKWPVVIAMKSDKDIEVVTKIVAAHASEIAATEFASGQDLPVQAVLASELATYFARYSVGHKTYVDMSDALDAYIDTGVSVLVTGSFYLVAQARAWLIGKKGATIDP